MKTDMTQGKPVKVLLGFTIPVFIGNVFQQFYNMVDAVVGGKFVGTNALAAVGSTGTIIFLIIGFLLGLTAGFTVLTAQKYGAGKMDEMRQTVGNALILTALVSAVMTAVSMTGMHALLKFMHTPDDIFKDAYAYVMIICGGIFAQALYNILASILRALGNSKVPLYFLILSAMLNIVLDLVFIIVFKLGAPGAAWATIISQGVSGVLCLVYIWKFVPELRMKKEDFSELLQYKPKMLKRILNAKKICKKEKRELLPKDLFHLKGFMVAGTDNQCYKDDLEEMWGVRPMELFAGTEPSIIGTEIKTDQKLLRFRAFLCQPKSKSIFTQLCDPDFFAVHKTG